MPPRNLLCLILTAVLALACYGQVQHNRYGRALGHVLDKISRRYYEPVDDAKLFQGGVEGMVEQLGDEHSAYYSPRQQQDFEESINRRFEGVGMRVMLDPKSKQLTVVTPLAGSPAYAAGIRAGDRILKISGRSTQGMSLRESIDTLHGSLGSSVALTVLHEGQERPVEITITRKTIEEDTVLGDTRNAYGFVEFFPPRP